MIDSAVISLGSNLGDRLGQLRSAAEQLAATPGVEILSASGVYQTAPVGGVEQDDFFNAVAIVAFDSGVRRLFRRCQEIENILQRTREVRWGPRTIDIDLIAVADRVLVSPDLEIPHPRAHERAFVLVPWLEIDARAALPGFGPVADLVEQVDTSGIRPLTARLVA